MNGYTFESPVLVYDGEAIREIGGVWDAIEFMEEWPVQRRGLIYETALDACYAAHDGRKPLETARRALATWARRSEILANGPIAPAWFSQQEAGPNPQGSRK